MARSDARVTISKIAKGLLWLVYAWVVVSLVLLFLAFVLQLFGADPNNGFAQWVYRSTTRAMAPFRGLFEPVHFGTQSVLDTSLLFAMIVYGFVALFLRAGIDWLTQSIERHRRQLDEDARVAPARTPAPASGAPQADGTVASTP
jgi:uncharacterized protein YggT (Ycf19 family)